MFKPILGWTLLFSWSASPAAEALTVSLREALRRAEVESPLLVRARAERETVAARQVGARVLLPANPYVFFNLFGQSSNGGSSFQPVYQLHLEQSFEVAGQRGWRIEEAARALRTADRTLHVARLEVRTRAIAAYAALSVAERRVEVSREQKTLGERIVEIVRSRQAAGAASEVDLKLSEAEAGRVEVQLAAAEADVAIWQSQLAEVLGLPPEPLQTSREQRPPAPVEPVGALTEQALLHRQEIAVLEASSSELDATVTRLHREAVPNPTLWFELMREPALLWVSGGIGLQIPVWRRHQGEIAVASSHRARVDSELSVLRKQVVHEVTRAVAKLKALAAQLETFEARVVPKADDLSDLVSEGWRAGKYDLQRVVLTKREAQTAKQERLDLVLQYWLTWIELERVLGAAQEDPS